MKQKSSLPMIAAAVLIVATLIYQSVIPSGPSPELSLNHDQASIEVAQNMMLDLTDEERRANMLVETLPWQEFAGMLGPEVAGTLAPIALSPFFALTCLSGASLLSSAGFLPEGLTDNIMMSTSSPLHNSAVFLGLLGLTVLTSLPKLTTVSKTFAQAVDQLEGYSGIIAALSVQVLSNISIDGSGAPVSNEVATVYTAGVFTFNMHGLVSMLLMVFSAINIFVVNSVKFFFEILAWISPIPTVDALFEAANKAFTAFLVGLYLINPWWATVLNLIIFAISLLIFSWSYRRVVFMRCVLGDPLFGWFSENVFRNRMTENSTKIPNSVARELPNATVVLKAFPGRKLKGVKKKTCGYLVHSEGLSYFVKPKLIGSNKVVQLSGDGIYPSVEPGFFSHGVAYRNGAGDDVYKILFTKRYNNVLDRIHSALNARGESVSAADAPTLQSMSRDMAESIKKGNKGQLQSEFA